MEVPVNGEYEVLVDYACPEVAGKNTCRLNCSNQILRANVINTDSWDQYRELQIGTIELHKGTNIVRFGADQNITGWLMDLRGLTLRPTKPDSGTGN